MYDIKKLFSLIFCRIFLIIVGIAYFLILTIGINYIIDRRHKNYLIISMTTINSIICYILPIIMIVIIYFILKLNIKVYGYLKLRMVFGKNCLIYWIIIAILIIGNIYSVNNYIIIKDDVIIKCNLLSRFNEVYNYSDIREVSIGVNEYSKNNVRLYYNIMFTNEYNINLTKGLLGETYDIDDLLEVNKKIAPNVNRKIDFSRLHMLLINMDVETKKKYEDIFNNKH